MSFRDGRKILLDLLREPLARHGFSHLGELTFGRDTSEGADLLSFSARQGREGEFCFSFGVGVRFNSVEALLQPEIHDPLAATVGKPLSSLKKTGQFPEWCLDGSEELAAVLGDVLSNIEQYALPFLSEYSSLVSVRNALEEREPGRWFTLTPEERVAVLAAIDYVDGAKAAAMKRLDDTLVDLEGAPEKRWWALRKLRGRLGE